VSVILPGSTIGVLGGGQLARMLGFAALPMGYRLAVLDASADAPAARIAALAVTAPLEDADAAERLAAQCAVVTLDTEHVPAPLLYQISRVAPVRPSARVLEIVQDRLEQRQFLESEQLPQVTFAAVDDLPSLHAAIAQVGCPAVLKTRRSGYDGKGQARIDSPAGAPAAWRAIGEAPAVLESFIEFEREISALLARDGSGRLAFHPIAENDHRDHILRTTRVPARISEEVAARARDIAERIAAGLDHVGMMAVEMFVLPDGRLLVNEIAPRTHNSGHYTIDACATSQFEQHLRAICGLPLGATTLRRPAVMLNLLGDLWRHGTPDWGAVLRDPSAHLHLYDKTEARPGRKMGHVVVLDDDPEKAAARIERIAADLGDRVDQSVSLRTTENPRAR
jgi:5-(carboxyamino)imidazole ribonucleotide synthase